MYIGTQPYSGIRARHTYTATAGQTSFSGAGAENVTLTYADELYIDVYQNGVKLSPADYTATSGTTVVLGTGATVSDIIEVVKYDAFSVADTVSAKDGGGFGGNISTSGTLAVTGTSAFTGAITSNAGGSATYQWVDCDNGNAPIAGATNQSYTATVSGNYAVVIVDGTCNAASVCEPVCVGTASNATEAACFSYVWALDGNTYTTAGQYTAVLANAAGCDSTVTLDLTINTVDNTTSVAGNTFTANLAGGTYLWIDCVTNNTIATETNQSFTPTTPGDYAVIVSDGTCSDTSDCVTSTVGLNENTLSKGFEIFPNPTKGAFTIAISGIVTDKVTVIITEARGKVIMTQEFTNVSESMELPVHLNSMEAGVYFVTITANDSKSVQRIVVTK